MSSLSSLLKICIALTNLKIRSSPLFASDQNETTSLGIYDVLVLRDRSSSSSLGLEDPSSTTDENEKPAQPPPRRKTIRGSRKKTPSGE